MSIQINRMPKHNSEIRTSVMRRIANSKTGRVLASAFIVAMPLIGTLGCATTGSIRTPGPKKAKELKIDLGDRTLVIPKSGVIAASEFEAKIELNVLSSSAGVEARKNALKQIEDCYWRCSREAQKNIIILLVMCHGGEPNGSPIKEAIKATLANLGFDVDRFVLPEANAQH